MTFFVITYFEYFQDKKRAGIWKYFLLGIFYLIFILHTYTYTITVLWPQQTNLEVLPLPLGYNNNHTIVFGVWTIGRLPNRLEGIDHLFKKNAQLLFKILTSRLTPRFELLLWRSRPGYTYIYIQIDLVRLFNYRSNLSLDRFLVTLAHCGKFFQSVAVWIFFTNSTLGAFTYDVTTFFIIFDLLRPPCHPSYYIGL